MSRFSQRSSSLAFAVLALTFIVGPLSASAVKGSDDEPIYTARFSDVAAKGYDVVAYFEDGRATEGSKEHEIQYRGATWRFSSAAHQKLFETDPERYAPRYGGYCAWAMAQGKKAPGDPRHWRIVDGKLYLNYSAKVQKDWEVDIPGFIASADGAWRRLTRP